MNQLKRENKKMVIETDQNLDLLKFHKHANTAELLDTNFSSSIPTISRPTSITHRAAALINKKYISDIKNDERAIQIIINKINYLKIALVYQKTILQQLHI